MIRSDERTSGKIAIADVVEDFPNEFLSERFHCHPLPHWSPRLDAGGDRET